MTRLNDPEPAERGNRFVAFLRGINVGGHHKIKMTDLARMFEAMGHRDVETIIASGNVLFTTRESDEAKLTRSIERAIASELGYEVRVMLRSIGWLRELVRLDPFAGYDELDGHRYVSFYPQPIDSDLMLPIHVPEEYYSLLAIREGDLFAISSKMPDGRHGDYGKFAAKAFGKVSTTRNWNTIVKITQL
jgi:uncharacterized protein (DUF1697 family)